MMKIVYYGSHMVKLIADVIYNDKLIWVEAKMM